MGQPQFIMHSSKLTENKGLRKAQELPIASANFQITDKPFENKVAG
jgi:hypothetical protein